MKRILSTFLIIALSVILLASCAKNTFDDVTSQLDKYSFKRADYDENQISDIEKSCPAFGITLEGKITKISHYITTTESGRILYVYAYEFEKENDALSFYEIYASKSDYSKFKNNVVVFGNSTAIDNLSI